MTAASFKANPALLGAREYMMRGARTADKRAARAARAAQRPWQLEYAPSCSGRLRFAWAVNVAAYVAALVWLGAMLISLPADRDAAWVRKFAEAFSLALAWQFTVQEAIKIFLLTFVSPQFAAKMFPPKGGRVAFSRTALHQVPNAILGVLRNVIA
jgi:hypothetical protein